MTRGSHRPGKLIRGWLIVWGLAWLAACGASAPEAGETEESSSEPPAVNVSGETIEPSTLVEHLVLAGRIEPWLAVDISSELGGTVQNVDFEKGQRVRAGQVLARIGTDLLSVALKEAEAELLGAEANFKKTSELLERQAIPRQEHVAATSRYQAALARVEQAKLRVERSVLKAPITGVAITRDVEEGEVIPPGARVTTLHQISRLKAEVGIPENDISYFEVGGSAVVQVDAYPDRRFEGRIHFIGSAATGQNRTFPSEIELANPGGKLRPGMIARVSLTKRTFESAVVVSRDALLERDRGTVAFVVEDDRARLREVELGAFEGDRVVVLGGLSIGDLLLVSGHRNLVDKQRVQLVD